MKEKSTISILNELDPVRGRLTKNVLLRIPIVSFSLFAIIGTYYHDIMLLTVGITISLYSISFKEAAKRLVYLLSLLRERGIISANTNAEKSQKDESGNGLATEDYLHFLKSYEAIFNSRIQWLFAILGSILFFLKYIFAYQADTGGTYGVADFFHFIFNHYILGNPFSGAFNDKSQSPILLIFEPIIGFYLGVIAWKFIVIGNLIRQLGLRFQFSLKTLHPDGCGGLSVIGGMCVWNALAFTGPGIFCGFWLIFGRYFGYGDKWSGYLWGILLVLTILSTISFLLPLWEIHKQMVVRRDRLYAAWESMRPDVDELIVELRGNIFTNNIDNLSNLKHNIAYLQDLSLLYKKLPVWPINTEILSKFAFSQIGAIIALFSQIIKFLLK